MFPKLKDPRYPNLPDELIFLRAEEIPDMYPELPPKPRETQVRQQYPAVFTIGIGRSLRTIGPRYQPGDRPAHARTKPSL